MAKICCHSFVSGIVQGVFYRANVKNKAEELGINGWARNLPDGRVEVFVCGEEAAIRELEKCLYIGSPKSEVDNVVSEVSKYQHFTDFKII